ncbi:hypothetical protein N0V82_005191 [Gnomoniopsis sp. IMI 355080]|nr:hypothetical protein N0V82_005191 [Gnomoniopsis sp. IMI 355080]
MGVIGLAIGQDLLIKELYIAVPKYTDAVSATEVIAAGAMGLVDLSHTQAVLDALRHAYADAVRLTLILALASACLAFPASCAMEWLNIKQIAEQRREAQDSLVLETSGLANMDPASKSTDEEKAPDTIVATKGSD